MHFLFRLTQKQRRGKASVLEVPTPYSLQKEAWVDMPQIARLAWRKGDPPPDTQEPLVALFWCYLSIAFSVIDLG